MEECRKFKKLIKLGFFNQPVTTGRDDGRLDKQRASRVKTENLNLFEKYIEKPKTQNLRYLKTESDDKKNKD